MRSITRFGLILLAFSSLHLNPFTQPVLAIRNQGSMRPLPPPPPSSASLSINNQNTAPALTDSSSSSPSSSSSSPSLSVTNNAIPSPASSSSLVSSSSPLSSDNRYRDDEGMKISLDSASKVYEQLASVASNTPTELSSYSLNSPSPHYDYLLPHETSVSDSLILSDSPTSIAETPVDSIRSAFMQLSASDPSPSPTSDPSAPASSSVAALPHSAVILSSILPPDAVSPVQPLVNTVDGTKPKPNPTTTQHLELEHSQLEWIDTRHNNGPREKEEQREMDDAMLSEVNNGNGLRLLL